MNKPVMSAILMALLGGLCGRAAEDSTNVLSRSEGTPDRRFGAGVILGEPIGASLKYWLNDEIALDGAVAWSLWNENNFEFHTDVLFHKFDWIPVSRGRLPFYFGGGIRLKLQDNDDDRFGLRGPVGLSYMFEDLPLDIFVEVGPVIDFTPKTRGGVTGGIGARYWF